MKDVNILTSNGVDVQKSLELFVDMETYDDTLKDFLEAVEEKKQALNKYKQEANMNSYAIDVHALKTDARYLGFNRLGEIAYEMEMKSKENDVMFIMTNHDRLMQEVDFCVRIAKMYLGEQVSEPIEVVRAEEIKPKDKAILIVDDSELVANFIRKMEFGKEYELIFAKDGEEAIKIVNNDNVGKIKCCLLDLNMPNINGFGVLEYFKTYNLFKKIPVSIMTGNDTEEQVQKAFEYPIVDVFKKPFNEACAQRFIEKTIALGNE